MPTAETPVGARRHLQYDAAATANTPLCANATTPTTSSSERREEIQIKTVRVAVVIALAAWPSCAFDNKATVTPVLTTNVTASGQPFTFPAKNAQLVVAIYDIPAGITLPEHKHSLPRFAYMLAGTLRVTNAETGKSDVYKAGDFIAEAIDQWHHGANIGTAPAKLLVIDLTEKGQSNVTTKN